MAEFNNYIGFTAVVDKVNRESVEGVKKAIQEVLQKQGIEIDIKSKSFDKIMNQLKYSIVKGAEEGVYEINKILGSLKVGGKKIDLGISKAFDKDTKEFLPIDADQMNFYKEVVSSLNPEIQKLINQSNKLNEEIAKTQITFTRAGGEIKKTGLHTNGIKEAELHKEKINSLKSSYKELISEISLKLPEVSETGVLKEDTLGIIEAQHSASKNLYLAAEEERQRQAEAQHQENQAFQRTLQLLDEKQKKVEQINSLEVDSKKHEKELAKRKELLVSLDDQIAKQKELVNSADKLAAITQKEAKITEARDIDIVKKEDIKNVREAKKAYDAFNFALQEYQRLSSDAKGFKARKMDTTAIDEAAAKYKKTYEEQYELLKKNTQATDELASATRKLEVVKNKDLSQTTELLGKQKTGILGLGEAFWKSAKRVAYYTVTYRALRLVIQGIQDAIKTTIEFDRIMVEIQMITGKTTTQLKSLAKEFAEIAKAVGATTQEVAEASKIWLQQGKTVQQTTQLTKASMTLAKVAMIEASDATEYLTAAMNAYGIATEKVMTIVDKLASVDMKAAVSTADLAEALTRTAESADIAGISLDKVLSYIATITETTRNSVKAGESLKSVFARMGNIKLGKLVDDETSESLSDVETALGKVGISLRIGLTEFRNFGDVLDEVAAGWKDLTSIEQNYIATALAGKKCA